MRNCFIPFCDAHCRLISPSSKSRMMFMPPKDDVMFNKWKDKLPKRRPFKKHDRICERHFHKDDIITTWDHIIKGKLHQLERSKPKLRNSAIPELNLNLDFQEKDKRKRENVIPINKIEKKSEKKNGKIYKNLRNVKHKIKNLDEINQISIPELTVEKPIYNQYINKNTEVIIPPESDISKFDSIYDDIYEVTLPNTLWGLHRDPDRQFIVFSLFDIKCMGALKMYVININLNTKLFIRNKLMVEKIIDDVESDYLTSILEEINNLKVCSGIYEDNYFECKRLITTNNCCDNCAKNIIS